MVKKKIDLDYNIKCTFRRRTSAGRAIEDCVRLYAHIIRVRSGIGCVVPPHTLCGYYISSSIFIFIAVGKKRRTTIANTIRNQ